MTPERIEARPPRFRCTACGARDVRTERDTSGYDDPWWPGPTPPAWTLTCRACGHKARGPRCGCGGVLKTDHGLNSVTMTCTRCGHRYRAAWG